MIHKQLERLIPYISEEAITYPLWEEGNYIPFLNLDIVSEKYPNVEQSICEDVYAKGYDFDSETYRGITRLRICPSFEYNEDGGFDYVKEDWSIEEMIDIVANILNKENETN